ncbi:hypothetical protein B0181_01615 [Moraxella caviae]|uniref:CDP-Glycerol:Poly(Glycerophosphate) glycerophosphotransferase n=1 Tax=Moraxella caviae TaxID=34060 RepID=A0A1T0AAZ0_9GAMM|nr:hypothetical protein [Moraxella caviae]OOR92461.1 hypothetical protein B0181_01615 [Moraxella caviae]STZ13832.1 Uncharacterised protein [Moraxella caviae]VEW12908.1 Uncharacterised protein [Moraxella caviae]
MSEKKINIVFVLHNMYVWDALSQVYQECLAHPKINTYVVIANDEHSAVGISQRAYSTKLTEYLLELKIPYFKIPRNDPALLQKFFDDIKPDYVFRQYPWEDDYPEIFQTPSLSRYKMVYIPYFAVDLTHFVMNGNHMEVNLPFHHGCHRIYCNSPEMLEESQRSYTGGGKDKFVYLGNTKLEHIISSHKPLHNFERTGKINILWCPHHSIDGMLNLGTFVQNCMDFVWLARQNPQLLHIKLRAHPFLFVKLEAMYPELTARFKQEWAALPNTSVDENWDCVASFSWSDLQITDGLSFLAEYPVIGKPSIFIEKEGHMPFNANGELAVACNYVAKNMQDVVGYLQDFLKNKLPVKQEQLTTFRNQIACEGVAKKIVEDLLNQAKLQTGV